MENLIQQLEATGDFRVICKLKKLGHFHEDETAIKKIGVVTDITNHDLNENQLQPMLSSELPTHRILHFSHDHET